MLVSSKLLKNEMSNIIDKVTPINEIAKNRKNKIFEIIDSLSITEQQSLGEAIQIINDKYFKIKCDNYDIWEHEQNQIQHANTLDTIQRNQYLVIIGLERAKRKQRYEEDRRQHLERLEKMIDIPNELSKLEQKKYFMIQVQIILKLNNGGLIRMPL